MKPTFYTSITDGKLKDFNMSLNNNDHELSLMRRIFQKAARPLARIYPGCR